MVRVLLVGWGAGEWDGIFSRLRLFSLPMRWRMEVFGTMTGVLNISSATLGQVLLNTSVRPLALAHYQDAIGEGEVAPDTGVLDTHVCQLGLEGWQKGSGWASLDLQGLYQFCFEVSIIWVVWGG